MARPQKAVAIPKPRHTFSGWPQSVAVMAADARTVLVVVGTVYHGGKEWLSVYYVNKGAAIPKKPSAKVVSKRSFGKFGHSLATSGKYLVVGAPYKGVFVYKLKGWKLVYTGRLFPRTKEANFGSSVAVLGYGFIAIGASGGNGRRGKIFTAWVGDVPKMGPQVDSGGSSRPRYSYCGTDVLVTEQRVASFECEKGQAAVSPYSNGLIYDFKFTATPGGVLAVRAGASAKFYPGGSTGFGLRPRVRVLSVRGSRDSWFGSSVAMIGDTELAIPNKKRLMIYRVPRRGTPSPHTVLTFKHDPYHFHPNFLVASVAALDARALVVGIAEPVRVELRTKSSGGAWQTTRGRVLGGCPTPAMSRMAHPYLCPVGHRADSAQFGLHLAAQRMSGGYNIIAGARDARALLIVLNSAYKVIRQQELKPQSPAKRSPVVSFVGGLAVVYTRGQLDQRPYVSVQSELQPLDYPKAMCSITEDFTSAGGLNCTKVFNNTALEATFARMDADPAGTVTSVAHTVRRGNTLIKLAFLKKVKTGGRDETLRWKIRPGPGWYSPLVAFRGVLSKRMVCANKVFRPRKRCHKVKQVKDRKLCYKEQQVECCVQKGLDIRYANGKKVTKKHLKAGNKRLMAALQLW